MLCILPSVRLGLYISCCCVSKEIKSDRNEQIKGDKNDDDKQRKVAVTDVAVHDCTYDILAKLVKKACEPNWTAFQELYAKG